ncbi:MAG: Xaa-Pro peptidase family protein [Candidatus Bathyarchaeota archaeon]|nr:Xaa-Pro peptidase family protein [Candidatus Bathyarchaeota archaeon]
MMLKEYKKRTESLKESMRRERIDIALLFQQRDIYYFSGTAVYSILVLPVDEEPILLVRINVERAKRETWIKNVTFSTNINTLWEILSEFKKGTIGIEKDVVSVTLYEQLTNNLPNFKFVNISPQVLALRMVKSEGELDLIRKASRISHIGLQKCEEVLEEGMTEIELESEIEAAKRKAGHEGSMHFRANNPGLPFGVVASGLNLTEISGYWIAIVGTGPSSARPYGASNRRIQKGDLVSVNHATVFQGYHSDEARMYVLGKATDKQRKIFNIVREAQEAVIGIIKPGVEVGQIYNAAEKIIQKYGYLEYFMAYGRYGFKYLGHGVGLEIDEPPLITPENRTVLRAGMVFALEPKVAIPGWGGVDIEDTIMVTEDGSEVLTLTRRELIEV